MSMRVSLLQQLVRTSRNNGSYTAVDREGTESMQSDGVASSNILGGKARSLTSETSNHVEAHERMQHLEELIASAAKSIKAWRQECEEQCRRVEELRDEIRTKESDIRSWEHEKEALMSHRVVASGPKCLRWVDGTIFHLVSALVVVTNIGVMFTALSAQRAEHDHAHTMQHPHEHNNAAEEAAKQEQMIWWLNQVFLIFYIVECALRWALFQHEYLCGRCSVLWNWLDLIIVMGGTLDQWILPILEMLGAVSAHTPAMSAGLQGLRLLRILRILKVVHTLLESDLTWAEGDRFQVFMIGVIAANCLVMGFETDPDIEKSGIVSHINNLFLAIYVFELVVRLRHAGCFGFFCGECSSVTWNILDFVIVLGGVVDQWFMPGYTLTMTLAFGDGAATHRGSQSSSGQVMMMLRMARLLRLLRLVRLIKTIDDLYKLVIGIVEAMQGMFWVLMLTLVVLYCYGLFCVKLFTARDGEGIVWFGGHVPPQIRDDPEFPFNDLPSAMWVLFMCMNGDPSGLQVLFDVRPWTKLLCAMFMVISSWAILSILTAVVSENMINANEQARDGADKEERETEEKDKMDKLQAIFELFDQHEPQGRLTWAEFEAAMSDVKCRTAVLEAANLDQEQVTEIFDLILKTKGAEDGSVSQKDFMEGMRCMEMVPSCKQILQLQAKHMEVLEHMRGEQGLTLSIEKLIAKRVDAMEQTLHEKLKFGDLIEDAIQQALQRDPVMNRVVADIADVKGALEIRMPRARSKSGMFSGASSLRAKAQPRSDVASPRNRADPTSPILGDQDQKAEAADSRGKRI